MDEGRVTPKTMPVGKTMPKATIWMRMWIHNVESWLSG